MEKPSQLPDLNVSRPEFSEEPKLSGVDVDKGNDELRLQLAPKIEELAKTHELFAGKNAKVTFAQHGISSLVAKIETGEDKYVFKTPVSTRPVEGEAMFLKAWEAVGVSVPRIVEEGLIGDRPYLLMDFVDADVLKRAFNNPKEIIEARIYEQMGATLRKMHQVHRDGYGVIRNGQPEYATFGEWLDGKDVSRKTKSVQEMGLLTDDEGSPAEAIETLRSFAGSNTQGSFCHNDLSLDNIFNTSPLTIFDPSPALNEGYIDIGKSIVINVAGGGGREVADQLIEGYFGKDGEINEKALRASVILNACFKFERWAKVGKQKQIAIVKDFLKSF